ncbi:Zinc finger protein 622 [Arabidopsis thaliana]|jgi:pre-60S factor REI1|uniref:Cytoplasmic 60S subunit biogenesis factor REI1 homolog 2 n=1 Tax=Arabidopsis thaliana TaxID=3702 RepID=REIL2_ARATH|nr:Zinc finger protein 622 [Arabidopsis thaliana]Q9ZQ18.1 RecName: Full=Cytoplasmic 60S subunit biogenesis factor REI1 homolog 2; AltName: Full=Protein REI1-LIKE 2; AltName: Full=pre-60S factor REI1 homolog 2 [Arabidopsis thaliana]AAD18121.1 putative C2H2-type zinc finger protein [Arabidopsis thaliana]AAD25324.1 C2H2 zinc finger protein FZF [Arabidopsis thaliana]AAL32698.1 putative C2H2-type zinc finger protein [Arabidopsis thaliana]AAM48014.1 putative C2H2-type zinc finger protein [Arabidopsi|eukprot:NP_180026.1 Zinc finger protein 622 [Arabidopsis thaliana]
MSGLACNSCNKDFEDDAEQKFHYKSEWHRYNLKRKIAGVPGVTEALFEARQAAIAQEKVKAVEAPMLYSCGICNKGYRSSKAHEQHLKSKSHVLKASTSTGEEDKAIIKQLPPRRVEKNNTAQLKGSIEEEESEDEWIEVDSDEDLDAEMNEDGEEEDMDEDGIEFELDPACCLMCDKKHKTIEKCMVHMHKFHGFFIPDIEYLKDPKGFLTYLGLKVKRDFVCLYCNELCHPFSSLEAVRKHMDAKGHCKVHYGDGGDEEDAELEEFYDYSSSYVNGDENQMVVSGESVNTVELFGGSELVITKRTDNKVTSRTLGSREFMRYYKQKPAPSSQKHIVNSLTSRYKMMGLATVQSKEAIVRMKVMREMNKRGAKSSVRLGMKSNVIRNLPNNVTY